MERAVMDAAEGVLTRAWGRPVRLAVGETEGLSGRTHVHRARVTKGQGDAPGSVIVKQPRSWDGAVYDPNRAGGPASTFLSEWAALELLTEVAGDAPVGPRFYGGDRAAGVMVMEDLGAGSRLDHALLGDDRGVAERTLTALMATLGRMHASTVAQAGRYAELRERLGPVVKGEVVHTMRSTRAKWLRDPLTRLDFRPTRGFHAELRALRSRWNELGDAHAYVHFDPCPDNCHWVDGDLRLLDLESGTLAPWAVDGSYPRIHFPTCWCVNRMPEPVWRAAEAAYRTELARGWPQADDDARFHEQMVGACAFWACQSGLMLAQRALDDDWEWGIARVRQRITMRFDLLAETCDEFGMMPATGDTARRLAEQLRRQWPESEDMPLYPAFRADANNGAG